MAEDEIDVEGEFDLKTELGEEFYDTNELPSKSANLLPEFTSPAWMLEQGWSLDSCMDEKSKATIEKMLLEEQQYMYGRKTSRYLSIKKNVLLVTASTSKASTPNKSPWTQEEKNTFLRGMGIFGRSWSKIASLIPTRTSLQVKNYAQQYMKNLAKKKAEREKMEIETLKSMTETPLLNARPSSLADTVVSVTTGQPTIATASTCKLSSAPRSPNAAEVLAKARPRVSKMNRPGTPPKKQAAAPSNKQQSKASPAKQQRGKGARNIPKKSMINGDATSLVRDIFKNGDSVTVISNKSRKKESRSNSLCSTSDGINGSGDISNSSFPRETKLSDDDDEEDVEVDIDIENDDDENPVLQSRSASPSSVYHQLLKSAHINIETKSNTELLVTGQETVKENGAEGEETQNLNAGSTDLDMNADPMCAAEVVVKTEEEEDSNSDTASMYKLESMSDDSSKDRPEDEEEEEHHVKTETIVNGLVASSGEVIEFEVPQKEKELLANFISDEEKRVHADFFDGRPPKTPERYLKIRSYIIDCWLKCKPTYLNKTCIRPGLKNCGDVNCIGRIHSYLECIGAINFGCEQAAYRNPHKTVGGGTNSRVKGINKDLIASFPALKTESTRPRKRRIRDGSGLWVDEKELEGKTIEHNNERKKLDANRKLKIPRSVKTVYDPFKLVPCLPFSDDNPAPCKIEMFNTALAIMDIHAHVSKTEVIGMLGGQFSAETQCLTISMAVPCKSMSTGMQCEMDPVSQTLASDQITDVGMSVVGWYHSHPTFSPDPSVRDIETQQKFQYWFSKGGNHFVGVIVSPYNASSLSVFSDIRCLTISDSHSKVFLCNLPYKFHYQVRYRDNLREILGPAGEIAEKYSTYVNRVMLSCQYRSSLGITCLSKMLQSVRRILVGDPDEDATSSTEISVPPTQAVSSTDVTMSDTNHQSPSCHTKSVGSVETPFHSPVPSVTSCSASNSKSKSLPVEILPPSDNSTTSLVSKGKVDEVIQWLEQIFIEKFSNFSIQPTACGAVFSSPHLPPENTVHQSKTL